MKKNTLPIKTVLRYIKNYKLLLVLSLVLALITVALSLYLPLLIGDAIDLIVGKGNVDLKGVASILGLSAIVIGITALCQWLMNMCNNKIAFKVVASIRQQAFEKLQELPLKYVDSHPHGDTMSRIISDAEQFADGLLMGFSQLFTGAVTILGTLFFMVALNWKIALLVVVLTPLSLFVARFIANRTSSMFSAQSKKRGEQTAFVEEMINGLKTVKAFAHEDENNESFDSINSSLTGISLKAIFFSSLTNPCTRFVNNIVYAAVALSGALAVISSSMNSTGAVFTVGMLSCLLTYANQYTKPFNEISGVFAELQNALTCASRIFELIEEPSEIKDADGAMILENARGEVELDNVSFSYVPSKKLISSLNLRVHSGQQVAIVGPTGCGKTTLINLLMRFYDVNEGGISVDGKDIRELTRRSLRESYGMVLQETWLKAGTVRDNIVMGKEDATDEEIIEAAKASHAHSFIKRLPKGYDTLITEDGGQLSQGQKQLLCITRIMLSLPPMLILDEATSSIDTRTELRIQKAFAKLMKGRTSFIVAHRLSTIMESDLILVMKDGNVIEQGSHEELLSQDGFYKELWNSQF